MTTLTAEEFLKITQESPEWARTLTENVTIRGNVILPENHPIKALSPKLIFQDHAKFRKSQISIAEGVFHRGIDFSNSQIREIGELSVLGTDEQGNAASFKGCKNLTVAKSTFAGFVDFSESGIQKIAEDLNITAPNNEGYAASFLDCQNLAIARGSFPGSVNFEFSEIEEITEDMNITKPNKYGNAANFRECKNLKIARGTFSGSIDFTGSGIQKIAENLHVTAPNGWEDAANFRNCQNLTVASGKFCGMVNFSHTKITHIRNLQITVPKGKRKAVFTEPCLEEIPFDLEEVIVSEELEEKLRPKDLQKKRLRTLHKNFESNLPTLPPEL